MSLLTRGVRTVRSDGVDRALLLTVRYVSSLIGYSDRVSRLPPVLASPIFSLTAGWVRMTLRILHRFYPKKYTDADPYRVLYVDPAEIERISGLHDRKRRGWVVGGNWDRDGDQFLDQPIPRSIYEHYVEEVPWDETCLSDLYSNEKRFNEKCDSIENLYERIQKDGFRSHKERLQDDPTTAWQNVNTTIAPHTDEITVDIGRDGEILWNMLGKHRLSIAKVAGVEEVPVLVFSRHEEWQDIRDRFRSTGEIPKKHHDHPDLRL